MPQDFEYAEFVIGFVSVIDVAIVFVHTKEIRYEIESFLSQIELVYKLCYDSYEKVGFVFIIFFINLELKQMDKG